ncbi:MAG: OsmC family peroxiredoxin, partial [Pseudomonadota bacterium]
MSVGVNKIAESALSPFFKVGNASEVGIQPPALRRGDALLTWVRSQSGFQKDAIVTSARTGDTWRFVSDEGKYLNGYDAAPPPLAFLTVGMVAAYMNEIQALAELDGVSIRKLRLIQENYYSMEGSMQKRTMIGGALPVELTVEIDCDLSGSALNQFLMNAVHASPLNGLMRGSHTSLFTLSKNGTELPPDKVAPVNQPALPDPGDRFALATPEPTDLDFLENQGLTPKKELEGGTDAAASSLADQQSRVLNLGAICTLREDGLKEITQLLYSPHGTAFRFLSDEAV